MTGLLAWTLGGLTVGFAAPVPLWAMVRRGVDAAVVLAVWALSLGATLIAVALPALAEVLHRCWLALHAGPLGRPDSVAGLLSAAAIVVAVVRGGRQVRRTRRQRRSLHERHVELAWLLHAERPRGGQVLWVPAEQPLAYSMAGSPPLVVMSAGLRDRLDRSAVAAVLAHERAHLQRRHHLVLAMAAAVAAAVAWLPLTRQSPALVRTLVELDADAHAARTCGPDGLQSALRTLGAAPAPPTALAIAGECTQLRLARLAAHRPDAATRWAGSVAAVCGMAQLFAVMAFLGVVAVTSLSSCVSG